MRSTQDSFGPNARAYATSAVHSSDQDLQRLIALLNPAKKDFVLDVGTGAGNFALALAPLVSQVIALDMTPQMLQVVAERAHASGFANLKTCLGNAEEIPLPSNHFDIVTNRLAAHHFRNIKAAIVEARRVLKLGGKLLINDTIAPFDDTTDCDINCIERLRDPSHVRNYKTLEWKKMVLEAGFKIEFVEETSDWAGIRMDFQEWMDRINTPQENRAELQRLFEHPSKGIQDALEIKKEDGSFSFVLPRMTLLATAI